MYSCACAEAQPLEDSTVEDTNGYKHDVPILRQVLIKDCIEEAKTIQETGTYV